MEEQPKKRQGFAALTLEKRKEIAASGGRKAQLNGYAHRWTREQAREAGRKGGAISRRGPARKQVLEA